MTKKAKKKMERNMELEQWAAALSPHLFNWPLLESRLTGSIASFEEMVRQLPNGNVIRKNPGDDPVLFIDNGGQVLAVAHLDATGDQPHFGRVTIKKQEWVMARWVDDRLGVFLILDVLPHFFKYDILLCTGEEHGHSSARFFDPPEGRNYNWMFEPDRMQTDVVHYQYYTHAMSEAVKAAGFPVYGQGSYSDIVELGHLGVAGINWGIGYEDNHGDWARANLNVTLTQTAKFARLFEQNEELVFPYTPKVQPPAKVTVWPVTPYTPPTGGRVEVIVGSFRQDQIVRYKVEGKLAMVSGHGYWDPNERAYCYWIQIPRPLTGGTIDTYARHLKVKESEITDVLTQAEEAEGQRLFPKGKLLGPMPSPSGKLLVPRTAEQGKNGGVLINPAGDRVRQEVTYGDAKELNELNEGFAFDETVMETRQILEIEYFDDWLMNSGYDIPWAQPWALVGLPYEYGDLVYTDDRRGSHRGIIDCPFPTVVKGEGLFWWVRFEKPDSLGLYVDIIKEGRLALRETPLALPAPVTVLSD